MKTNNNVCNYIFSKKFFKLYLKIELCLVIFIMFLSITLSGCSKDTVPSANITSTTPQACYSTLEFVLKKFPEQDTTSDKLLAVIAVDYKEIRRMFSLAKICARHDIMASSRLREKPLTVGHKASNAVSPIDQVAFIKIVGDSYRHRITLK